MSSMREKIARAIYERRNGRGCKSWGNLPMSHQDPYLTDADAVLDALMEPTEGMNSAGAQIGDYPWDGNKPSRVFVAMIAAAKEGK